MLATALLLAVGSMMPAPDTDPPHLGPSAACDRSACEYPADLGVDTLEVSGTAGLEIAPHAEFLPSRQLTFWTGWTTPPGGGNEEGGGGSGNQTYLGGIGWGATPALTLFFGLGINDDPTYAPVRGAYRAQYHEAFALGARALMHDLGWATLGVQGAAEIMWISSEPGLFNSGDERDGAVAAGAALDLPLTFRSGNWSASVVPSVARLPASVLGADYFGTMVRLGARVDTRVSNTWTVWSAAELSLGPGTNALMRDGRLRRLPTWRTGVRFHGTDRVTINASVTNAAGGTPATRHLTQLSAPVTLYSAGLRYAPTVSEPRDPASGNPTAPLEGSGGIAVPGAVTLPPGRGRITAGIDTEGAVDLLFAWALGSRFQFELLTTRIRGPDAPSILEASLGDGFQYRFGPQLQIFGEDSGAPFTLAGRLTVGRDVDVDDQQGYLLLEAIAERNVGPVTVILDPVLIQSGGRDLATLGVGARIPTGPVIFLPETRASFTGEPLVWTLGARLPRVGRVQADLFVTNAGSTLGVGRLLADPDRTHVGLILRAAL